MAVQYHVKAIILLYRTSLSTGRMLCILYCIQYTTNSYRQSKGWTNLPWTWVIEMQIKYHVNNEWQESKSTASSNLGRACRTESEREALIWFQSTRELCLAYRAIFFSAHCCSHRQAGKGSTRDIPKSTRQAWLCLRIYFRQTQSGSGFQEIRQTLIWMSITVMCSKVAARCQKSSKQWALFP